MGLEIIVSCKLPKDLKDDVKKKLKDHLDPNRKLKDKMLECAKLAATQTLHQTSPLEYYLQFDTIEIDKRVRGDHPGSDREVSVREELTGRIMSSLHDEFGIDEYCEIVVKQANTTVYHMVDRYLQAERQGEVRGDTVG